MAEDFKDLQIFKKWDNIPQTCSISATTQQARGHRGVHHEVNAAHDWCLSALKLAAYGAVYLQSGVHADPCPPH